MQYWIVSDPRDLFVLIMILVVSVLLVRQLLNYRDLPHKGTNQMPSLTVPESNGTLVLEGKYQQKGYGFIPGTLTVSHGILRFQPAQYFSRQTVVLKLNQLTAMKKFGAHTVGDGYFGRDVYVHGTFGFVGFFLEVQIQSEIGTSEKHLFAVYDGGDQLVSQIAKHLN